MGRGWSRASRRCPRLDVADARGRRSSLPAGAAPARAAPRPPRLRTAPNSSSGRVAYAFRERWITPSPLPVALGIRFDGLFSGSGDLGPVLSSPARSSLRVRSNGPLSARLLSRSEAPRHLTGHPSAPNLRLRVCFCSPTRQPLVRLVERSRGASSRPCVFFSWACAASSPSPLDRVCVCVRRFAVPSSGQRSTLAADGALFAAAFFVFGSARGFAAWPPFAGHFPGPRAPRSARRRPGASPPTGGLSSR